MAAMHLKSSSIALLFVAALTACRSGDSDRRAGDVVANAGDRSRSAPASGDEPLLIVFTGDFCPPCRVMKPWIDEIAAGEPGVAVVRINVDRPESEGFVTYFQVESVPTLVFADRAGEIVARREGLMSRAALRRALTERGWGE